MPIRRNKNIIPLSKDHHITLLFCWKLRTGLQLNVEKNRIKNYIEYFWQTHMQPHFMEEETILFAPIQDEAVKRALHEHAEIEQQISLLLHVPEMIDFNLHNLANAVDAHVRYEERELFPHLEKILTELQLEQIGNALQKTHSVANTDTFTDEFWKPANTK